MTHEPPQRLVPPPQLSTQLSAAASQTWPAPHVLVPASQRSVDSLQDSLPLQDTPSSQLRAVPPAQTAAAEQASPTVQKSPSSHAAPVLADHAEVDALGSQTWHPFAGLVVLGA